MGLDSLVRLSVAYRRYFAAVDPSDIDRYRRRRGRTRLRPVQLTSSSNLLTYAPSALGAMIEAAAPLGDWLWHPFASPVYLSPERTLHWLEVLEVWADEIVGDEWARGELTPTLDLFRDAVRSELGIASALEPPQDRRRARRVTMPFRFPK